HQPAGPARLVGLGHHADLPFHPLGGGQLGEGAEGGQLPGRAGLTGRRSHQAEAAGGGGGGAGEDERHLAVPVVPGRHGGVGDQRGGVGGHEGADAAATPAAGT